MAAPVASFVQLPLDTGNTGKKIRTQTRVVGADTVHEHFFISISARSIVGVFWATVPLFTPPTAAQNGTTTGAWWLFNPVGTAIKGAIRRWSSMMNFAVVSAIDLVPGQFRISLFTFTGTASGAALTPGKRDSTDAAAVLSLRTASTGLTVTLVATVWEEMGQTVPQATAAGSSALPTVGIERNPDEVAEIILRPGEGIVEWSALALTTANRRRTTNIGWLEFE